MKKEITKLEIWRDIPPDGEVCLSRGRVYALLNTNGVYKGQLDTHYISMAYTDGNVVLPGVLNQLIVLRDHLIEVCNEMEKVPYWRDKQKKNEK